MKEPHERESKAHHTVDWDAAFLFFANLPRGLRSYRKVSAKFHVSRASVRKAADRYGWGERMREIDAKADVEVAARIVRERSVRVADTIDLIDLARQQLLERLRMGEAHVDPTDLVALVKLENLLEGEATDRVDIGEANQAILLIARAAAELIPRERQSEFMERLDAIAIELDARLPAGQLQPWVEGSAVRVEESG
jgi:hypothetical protein